MNGVVPRESDSKRLLDAAAPQYHGYSCLAAWFGEAEHLWDTHGTGKMTLTERWDFNRELSAQFPVPQERVVYAKAGKRPASTIVEDSNVVLDHKLYGTATGKREAQFVTVILNSETARSRAAHMQSRSQWGTRDFDKLIF